MKQLKTVYAKCQNMGDALNEYIIHDVFGYDVVYSSVYDAQIMPIGSYLGYFFLNNDHRRNVIKKCAKKIYNYGNQLFSHDIKIWGTGFIDNSEYCGPSARRLSVHALRGEMSRRKLESICKREINCSLGDGGLLASLLLKQKCEKKYSVGVIAHFREQDHPVFKKLTSFYPDSIFIDVLQSPIDVITKIAECECVVSSSLHGLIISDSLGIPNLHIVVTDKLMGDGFKFDDYYSAFGIKHSFIDVTKTEFPSVNMITDNYMLSESSVNQKKTELIEAFPFPNNAVKNIELFR